jgi:hypothetical protein
MSGRQPIGDMSDFQSFPTRRSFVKKTLAGVFIASQPLILSGLIRASGGGSSGTGTKYDTTDFYCTFPDTTEPYGMDTTMVTDWGTTEVPFSYNWYY